jgi:antitoxin Phd
MSASWTLQDAKNRFSAVVEAAQRGQPQLVTKRGKPAVVVIEAAEYERLQAARPRRWNTIFEALLDAPEADLEIEPHRLELRDVEL